MLLNSSEFYAITDSLEGWELIEFLQVSIEEILASALDNDWLNEDNVEDVLELIKYKGDNDA